MNRMIFFICMTSIAATQTSGASVMPTSTRPSNKLAPVVMAEHVVGVCRFKIANMFGGNFKVNYPNESPPNQGSYHFPIIGKNSFISDGFGLFCKDSNEVQIATSLNAKYVDGHWLRFGPVDGPEFVPFEKQANARTIPLKGKNWTGIAYTEDDTTGDEQRRSRMFHFCLIHGAHALCGHTPVKWLRDRKNRNDLNRVKAILESVEFVGIPTSTGTSGTAGATNPR